MTSRTRLLVTCALVLLGACAPDVVSDDGRGPHARTRADLAAAGVFGQDPGVLELAADLERAGVSAEPFARELAVADSEEAPLRVLPDSFRERFEALHARVAAFAAPEPQTPGQTSQALSGSSGRAAVMIVASGLSRRWLRNIVEWINVGFFNTNLRGYYQEATLCTGDEGTWDCFRSAFADYVARADIRAIDLFSQVHGSSDGPSAVDAQGSWVTAAELLPEGQALKLRYGMFMNCWGGLGDSGFAQTFVRRGGRAAYGAEGVSNPTSDMLFEVYFGTVGETFGDAVRMANDNPVDWFGSTWAQKKGGEPFTPKIPHGVDGALVDD
jgi:hypothetical protein